MPYEVLLTMSVYCLILVGFSFWLVRKDSGISRRLRELEKGS